ncbi:hypothetical protein Ssi03_66130 [Sphaerisporangium siamense]|uniref:Uncharacterized protein n=1 Tax=Sphaerisporangium siamense TaxID=795645 RepID=A0A7W7DFV5_9ACTN|nr:SCO2521 family protein [Sphaerisporangium siamense]MBB4706022.1 hypothetical protein [Sphaerisporangium siamense]GII88623.1 hypothetical protein Ssi03_66130 [Sphaerisporangium siamense]
MLVLGEVRTALLQNSGEIDDDACASVLALTAGEPVRVSRRPIAYAVSPDRLVGVDCGLPSASRARVRGVGTVVARGTITGGRVVQGSAHTRVERGADRRLPWSHYMARPGVVEVLGKVKAGDVAEGFDGDPDPDGLDLGSIGARLVDLVQSSPGFDRRASFKAARTRVRWVAETGEPAIRFTVRGDGLRTLRVVHAGPFTPAVLGLCEDLALHDWLLTTVLRMAEKAGIGVRPDAAARLAPAIDHLLHLWMPAAHVDPALLPFWDSLDRRSGFTRQWLTLVDRIRDQVAVNTLALLRVAAEAGRRCR